MMRQQFPGTSVGKQRGSEETGVGQPPQNRQPRFDDYAESEDAADQTAQGARGERYEVPHFGYSRNLHTKEAEFLRIEQIPIARHFKNWKIALRDEVAGASGRPDEGFSLDL